VWYVSTRQPPNLLVRLIYLLTLPPNENSENADQQLSALQAYKEAFLDKEILGLLTLMLVEPLKNSADSHNKHFGSYILGIIKHLLSIPGTPLLLLMPFLVNLSATIL
jgi:hypothetical protein